MLRSLKELRGYSIQTLDGTKGEVKDFYFDDLTWGIRYLDMDTGRWLPGRRVLLSPNSFKTPEWKNMIFPVNLTKDQIEKSPPIESDKPVSRQNEESLNKHYGLNPYWNYPPFAMMSGRVVGPATPVAEAEAKRVATADPRRDVHLRSINEIIGYGIQAKDGPIGKVEDFITNDSDWGIRFMIVDTSTWLPGSKKVIIPPHRVSKIVWEKSEVVADLTREQIKKSPSYDPSDAVNVEHEERFYDYYGRPQYWK